LATAILGAAPLLILEKRAQAISAPSFIVFFGFGQTELSTQGRRTIAAFVDTYFVDTYLKSWNSDSDVALYANTDTAEASESLAQARGEAVRTYLAELGVPVERVVVFAYGGTRPLVITAPNVREPQNRRVEIALTRFKPRSGTP
jgi:outer membrane protein OmpA-like peptidoglycan-associated protein